MEKKVREYVETQYPYWAINLMRKGAYLKFIENHSNIKNTTEENFTMIDQTFQSFDDNSENLN